METILRIHMGDKDAPGITKTPLKDYQGLSGRGMTSAIISKEVPPMCFPLGEENKIVFAHSLISGGSFLQSGRVSVGCKSPLTGMISEANAGGSTSHILRRLGYGALVIEGKPEGKTLYKILINKSGVKILPADDLKKLGNNELLKKIRKQHGKNVTCITIGPAGELKLSIASLTFTDGEMPALRHDGKGGLGAVMGSKKIKAIILDPEGLPEHHPADPKAFIAANDRFNTHFKNKFFTGDIRKEAFHKSRLIKNANTCGIHHPATINEINAKGEDWGLDIVEMWRVLKVAINAGLGEPSDSNTLLDLVDDMGTGTRTGRILGSGADVSRRMFDVSMPKKAHLQKNFRKIFSKDQSVMATYLPETPMPECLPGNDAPDFLPKALIDHNLFSKMYLFPSTLNLNVLKAGMDMAGYGPSITLAIFDTPEIFRDMVAAIHAFTGIKMNEYSLIETGNTILQWENEFNEKTGIPREQWH